MTAAVTYLSRIVPSRTRPRHRGVRCRFCPAVVAALVPVQLPGGGGTRACMSCARGVT